MRTGLGRCLGLLLLATVGGVCRAQDWTPCTPADLLKAKAASDALYATIPDFSMRIGFASYRSASDELPFEQVKASVSRNSGHYRGEIQDVLTVQDKAVRVAIDRQSRTIMVMDAHGDQDPYATGISTQVVESAASCAMRRTVEGVEYEMSFPNGAMYDRMLILYDAKGWLRRTVSFWRKAIQVDPDDAGSPSYRPKLVATYAVPKALSAGLNLAEMDPATYVSLQGETPTGVGQWANYEIIDSRIRP